MWDYLLYFLPGFLLMVFRVGSLMFSLSFLSRDSASRWPRMIITVSMGAILFLVDPIIIPMPDSLVLYGILVIREMLVGIFLGLCLSSTFHAIRIAGEIIGRDMGLSMARVMDPAVGSGGVVIASLFEMLAVMMFFYIGGHRIIFGLLAKFNQMVPLGGGFNVTAAVENVAWFGSYILNCSIVVAAPVFTIMLLLTLTMMIVGRAIPQVPIMQFGLGIRICVGMYACILFVGRSMPKFREMFDEVCLRLWDVAGELGSV